jgi:anti-sigma B factor antagonist
MSFFYIMDGAPHEDVHCEEDVAVLSAGGDIDYSATPQLRERLADQIEAGKRRLVLDLSKVTFIDSTAIGALVGALVRLQDADGGSLAVVCDEHNRKVIRIFEIAGVESSIALYPTCEEALLALAMAG